MAHDENGRARNRPLASAKDAKTENRRLPLYTAGEIDVPVRIFGHDERLRRETFWSEHSHPTHELIWPENGTGLVAIGPRTWTITASIGMWVPAGMLHSGQVSAGARLRTAHFVVDTQGLTSRPASVAITPLLRLLLERLIVEGLTPESHRITEAMILDVITPAADELLLHVPQNPLLAPVVRAARDNPADIGTLESWAGRLGVSSRTVTRAFESETGLSFSRWVATARAQRAVALLGGGHDIDDVARHVGFRSTSAFTTAFRRLTGTTPGRYRSWTTGT